MSYRWAMVLVLVPSLGHAEDKLEVIQGTTGSRSDRLEIHSGGLVLRAKQPGTGFGWVRLGKGKRQLSYVLVFKHSFGGTGKNDFTEDVMADDDGGGSKQTIIVDGRKLEVAYKVQLDKPGKVSKEMLTINGKAADLTRGRVVLVDLTLKEPKWEQKKLKLPDGIDDTAGMKVADTLVKTLLANFAKQDKKVKAFLDAAKK